MTREIKIMTEQLLRLGVNIDHVATIRNARGGVHPSPLNAAHLAAKAGADGITAHLREDRRHISDADISALMAEIALPLNLEMAATAEMLEIALSHKPNACCIVPEKREELTTEGGLDVVGGKQHLSGFVNALKASGIRVSLFIDAGEDQITASADIGADIIELHTGRYCELEGRARADELARLVAGAELGAKLGLEVHAGHGLNYETVGDVAKIPQVQELNIGHFLVGEAIFVGFEASIKTMRKHMDTARGSARS